LSGGNDPSAVDSNCYDFDKLSSLVKRLDALESEAPEMMKAYYDPVLHSFVNQPGRTRHRVCVTSSAYALLTLTLSSDVYKSIVSSQDDDSFASSPGDIDRKSATNESDGDMSIVSSDDRPQDRNKIPIGQVVKTLLSSEWREDDLFQVALLMYTVLRLDSPTRSILRSVVTSNPKLARRFRNFLKMVLEARPHRKSGTQQAHSDYIYYQVCKVLAQLQDKTEVPRFERDDGDGRGDDMSSPKNETKKESNDGEETKGGEIPVEMERGFGGLPVACLPEGVSTEVFWGLFRCAEVSSNELCRQLAYRVAGDYNSFDVVRLAYCLLTYHTSTKSISNIAGILGPFGSDAGPAPETKVAPLNRRLVKAALKAYFEEQNKDGLWPKGQPIYKSFTTGKDSTGNGFIFSVNTVGSLLCALPAEYFRPHLSALEKSLEWIEGHQSLEIITDFCDRRTGQCYGKPLRGWNSPHLSPDDGPRAWPTAQVLKCVSWMKRTIRQLIHNDVLEEFNGVAFSKKGIQSSGWDRLLVSGFTATEELQ